VSRGKVWRAEVCNRAKDGTLYWVDTTIVPFTDSQGRITQHVAIRADITQRKVAEANLAEKEQQLLDEQARLSAFVAHAPAAIAMFDREMRIVAVSQRFVTDHRLQGRDIIGQHYDDVLLVPPERWWRSTESRWRVKCCRATRTYGIPAETAAHGIALGSAVRRTADGDRRSHGVYRGY
jgi:PAS domain-containing protein